MGLNKKSVDDINVKGLRVLCRCDFNVPLKDGKITEDVYKRQMLSGIGTDLFQKSGHESCQYFSGNRRKRAQNVQ